MKKKYYNNSNLRTLFLLFINFYCSVSVCQNLVLNSDFETQNICSEFGSPCSLLAWKNVFLLSHLYNYIKVIDQEKGISYRIVCMDYKQGNKTYLQTKLICPLEKGTKYTIEFDLFNTLKHVPDIGIAFVNEYIYTDFPENINLTPNILINDHFNPKGKNNWSKVKIEFVASKEATNMIIGNFQPLSGIVRKKKSHMIYQVFVDNFSVKRSSGVICTDANTNTLSSYSGASDPLIPTCLTPCG